MDAVSSSALREHWDGRYSRIGPTGVSWYEAMPSKSLELIDGLGVDRGSSLIDVGGGASVLVDALTAHGWRNLTVLDVSPVAIGAAMARLGPSPVTWLVNDALRWRPQRRYDVWHDRAVFHFLTSDNDRELYRRTLAAAVRPGGYVILSTFAPDGPSTCSGLPVQRYNGQSLARAVGAGFELLDQQRQLHRTPNGAEQPLTWVVLRAKPREGHALDDYLDEARASIDRVQAEDLQTEMAQGALVVDIRPTEQRERDGVLSGAVVVDRNVLEWRLVTGGAHCLPEVSSADQRIVLVCNEGYASSVAATTLRNLGMHRATDLAGGFQAWLCRGGHGEQ